MKNVQFILADLRDTNTIQRLGITSYKSHFDYAWSPSGLEKYLEEQFNTKRIEEEIKSAKVKYFLIQMDEKEVGYIKMILPSENNHLDEDSIEIEKIYLLKESVGNGIGQKAMEYLFEFAQKNTYSKILLDVLMTNSRGINFYLKMGFIKVKEVDLSYGYYATQYADNAQKHRIADRSYGQNDWNDLSFLRLALIVLPKSTKFILNQKALSMNANSTTHPLTPQTTAAEIQRLFELQRANQYRVANSSAKERRAKIKALLKAVEVTYREDIHKAAYADFRKSAAEVDATEVYGVISDCRFALKSLGHWMRPKPVGTPTPLLGSKSYIHYEPKGVVLIISPWNFPLLLTLGPLVSALAAGNCVLLKPSEMTPNMSALMKRIITDLFDENEVALIEGSIPETTSLLELPFNHIFFTGSPKVGKIVMAAAAKHLSSVTLELGGKSPTIVDQTANLNAAAERIAWSKFLNNGQICIAPDYVLIHESQKEAFIAKVKKKVEEFYGSNVQQSPDYCRIVNERHYRRIKSYVEDAIDNNAVVVMGGELDDKDNYIEPTLLTNISKDSQIMQEEIFGPVLPILTFKNREEVTEIINSKEKPLALYIYSRNKKNIQYFLNSTRAGGTVINHSAIHYNNPFLPFGGSNNSGIGKGHGHRGFEEFSNERGVLQQVFPFSSIKLFMPPYNKFTRWVIDFAVKWL